MCFIKQAQKFKYLVVYSLRVVYLELLRKNMIASNLNGIFNWAPYIKSGMFTLGMPSNKHISPFIPHSLLDFHPLICYLFYVIMPLEKLSFVVMEACCLYYRRVLWWIDLIVLQQSL